ncbi:MAG TPA: BlaI/MecI/CopY family transcriptional regulator [Clostridiales bacterium]|nr:BlaI/MecI/CopY family transcriptional regulator [Clostridiales bacterium]
MILKYEGRMPMKDYSIGDSEYRLMELIWQYAPISSGELSDICEQMHGWKKTTVYTMIKRLCDKGFIANNKAKITYLVRKEEVQHHQSNDLVQKNFQGSLPSFVNAFLGNGDNSLSKDEAAKLIEMIEKHTK